MATKIKAPAGKDWENIQIGDQVKHPKWGDGTVLFRSGAGDAAKAIVVFPEEGQKKLMLRHANLKKTASASRSTAKAKAKAAAAPPPPAAEVEVVAGGAKKDAPAGAAKDAGAKSKTKGKAAK